MFYNKIFKQKKKLKTIIWTIFKVVFHLNVFLYRAKSLEKKRKDRRSECGLR